MFEKVNPKHPDKVADRIAGALVDLAYLQEENPRIAVEVLIGHGICQIITESSVSLDPTIVSEIVRRISEDSNIVVNYHEVSQDSHLSRNQQGHLRCGDNGIFKGRPLTKEQVKLSKIAQEIYKNYPSDGKYIINHDHLTICQSKSSTENLLSKYPSATVNPLGNWEGGVNVDSGATNRKLGSDMGDSVTGGGLHGKDLSKADVSVNIYAHLKSQKSGKEVNLSCAIGDEEVDGKLYSEIVEIARDYINNIGGFEKFAEWGLIK